MADEKLPFGVTAAEFAEQLTEITKMRRSIHSDDRTSWMLAAIAIQLFRLNENLERKAREEGRPPTYIVKE